MPGNYEIKADLDKIRVILVDLGIKRDIFQINTIICQFNIFTILFYIHK